MQFPCNLVIYAPGGLERLAYFPSSAVSQMLLTCFLILERMNRLRCDFRTNDSSNSSNRPRLVRAGGLLFLFAKCLTKGLLKATSLWALSTTLLLCLWPRLCGFSWRSAPSASRDHPVLWGCGCWSKMTSSSDSGSSRTVRRIAANT